MIDPEALLGALAPQAATPAGQAVVGGLRSVLTAPGVPPARRRAEAAALVREAAATLLTEPWTLPPEADAALQAALGWDAAALLRALLAAGRGLPQLSLAGRETVWVPDWLVAQVEARAGARLAAAAERWVLPPAWPLPVRQRAVVLPEAAAVVAGLVAQLPAAPPLPCDGPEIPAALTRAPADGAVRRREELAALAADAPQALLPHLLGPSGTPLVGCAALLVPVLVQAAAAARRWRVDWQGQLALGLAVARAGPACLLTPGWLGACLHLVGLACVGAPVAATQPVEETLLRAHGGEVWPLADGLVAHQFPAAAGAVLRRWPLAWADVPDLQALEPTIAPTLPVAGRTA